MPEHLAAADKLPLMYQDRPRFQVRIECVTPIAEVEYHMVARWPARGPPAVHLLESRGNHQRLSPHALRQPHIPACRR